MTDKAPLRPVAAAGLALLAERKELDGVVDPEQAVQKLPPEHRNLLKLEQYTIFQGAWRRAGAARLVAAAAGA